VVLDDVADMPAGPTDRLITHPIPMLQVGSSPLYRQLADVIRQRIARGIWDVGAQIPSYEGLAAEFGVALITVRQAVALLSQEGLVHAQRGRGTHVIARPPVHPRIRIESSLAGLAEVYRTSPPRLRQLEEGESMPVLDPGEGRLAARYHYIRRVHVTQRQAVSVISLWLDDSVFRLSPRRFRRELIIPPLLDLAGDRIAKATQTLTVSTAGPEAAQALAISENAPVAVVRRVVCDHAGIAIYVCDLVYRSEYIKWEVDLLSPGAGAGAGAARKRQADTV
jgi:GntR family transcriptional regulator